MEPKINRAYETITGYQTDPSGFWIPDKSTRLNNSIGASPDAKVKNTNDETEYIGIAEFKAPIHKVNFDRNKLPIKYTGIFNYTYSCV